MAKLMSKSQLVEKIAEQHPNNMTRKDVKGVIESLAEIGYKELKKNGGILCTGICEICCHQEAGHKGAEGHQSVHKGANDIQGETSSEDHRARPVKAAKDAVA